MRQRAVHVMRPPHLCCPVQHRCAAGDQGYHTPLFPSVAKQEGIWLDPKMNKIGVGSAENLCFFNVSAHLKHLKNSLF